MTFWCDKGDKRHQHETVREGRECTGMTPSHEYVYGWGTRPFPDPRLDLLAGMIDLIPDGYYATPPRDEDSHVDFIRVSRPQPTKHTKQSKYVGCIKVQTQHSEDWKVAAYLRPNNLWMIENKEIIQALLYVVADHRGCSRRYAIEVQSCCVCNTTLTDDRSRHYLIGPVCDKKEAWTWVLADVDEKNDGLTFEDLIECGRPTRVWQESHEPSIS